jgi:hypothetical protein
MKKIIKKSSTASCQIYTTQSGTFCPLCKTPVTPRKLHQCRKETK